MSGQLLAPMVRAIDRFAQLCGVVIAWLMVPLVAAVVYEVVARYAFAAPTIWSFDVTYMLYGAMFMLGAAYALRIGAHIRTDFFWERWSLRTRGVIDSVAYIVFFFPGIALFLWVGWDEAWYAYEIGELSEQTPWRPALWPLKACVPLAAALLLLQGVSELTKSLHAAITGRAFESGT
ncbi:MAG TPA: TRAP transporter small permease subunit [Burkholderiales bacterium]|jgi:TRAP-type mannitol/chloroaromatic compound transport system permease small subunit|nr:TRAP transporter small permease subunit [Burkholderiales bacterium]HEU0259974.1 TRAP transporter small permease subunit [Burkholderiales bacterium]